MSFYIYIVRKSIVISETAYEASENADAIIITTEWDEFKVNLNHQVFG